MCLARCCTYGAGRTPGGPTDRLELPVSVEKDVSHLRRLPSLYIAFPGLTPWANFCRASGDTDPIRTVYSRLIY